MERTRAKIFFVIVYMAASVTNMFLYCDLVASLAIVSNRAAFPGGIARCLWSSVEMVQGCVCESYRESKTEPSLEERWMEMEKVWNWLGRLVLVGYSSFSSFLFLIYI